MKPPRDSAVVAALMAYTVLIGSDRLGAAPIDLSAWRLNTSGATGHSVDSAINAWVSTVYADVREVWYTDSDVYIKATGVPSYNVGPFEDGNPSYPTDRNWLFRVNRDPQPAAAGTQLATPLGPIGLFVNGVPIFNPKDGHTYHNQHVWNNNAAVVEADGFDDALGHPAPIPGSPGPAPVPGIYHHHQLSPSLMTQLGGIDPSEHSPLIGFAFDGYPIYGPYGYANADGTGGIAQMTSSYQLRDITQRHSLPDGTVLPANQWGPDVSEDYPLGYFVEDYSLVSGTGSLDEFNGRFTVTPDYPTGTYAYFATIVQAGENAYPYLLGFQYYGVVDTDNFVQSIAIPENAERYVPEPSVLGDANGDGKVDLTDFGVFKDHFGTGTTLEQGDFNGDGKVDLTDFGILKENFGKSGTASVPEPAALVLAMLGLASFAAFHAKTVRQARQASSRGRIAASNCSRAFSCADGTLPVMKPLIFSVHSDGPDRTGLVMLAEHYVNQVWVPTHLTPDQAREFALDHFKRAVAADLEMLEVRTA